MLPKSAVSARLSTINIAAKIQCARRRSSKRDKEITGYPYSKLKTQQPARRARVIEDSVNKQKRDSIRLYPSPWRYFFSASLDFDIHKRRKL